MSNSIKIILLAAVAAITVNTAHAEGPSFNFRYAKAPDEILICQDERLAALDREMASTYWNFMNHGFYNNAREIRVAQRAWLKQRRACGYDYECISKLYDDRLSEISGN
jgi:uncharacterized protein